MANILLKKCKSFDNGNFGNQQSTEFNNALIDKLIAYGVIQPSDKINRALLNSKLEHYLLNEITNQNFEACFQLGQLLFFKEDYAESVYYFDLGVSKICDYQCMFQLGVIYFDGLGRDPDPELGCAYMKKIFEKREFPEVMHLVFSAAFNIGRAYYQGYGCNQSDIEAEKYWLFAADDGNPSGSVMAQSALGFFYSTNEHFDLKKAFFWHSEACGNGSVESQGCLGVMYLHGIGVPVDWEAALICLTNAAERGSVYAKGNLCYCFYKRKLFTKAADLAAKVSQMNETETETLTKFSSEVIDEYLKKGISIACFIFARCLHLGVGVKKNCEEAYKYYSKSYEWDADLCADFQKMTQHNQL